MDLYNDRTFRHILTAKCEQSAFVKCTFDCLDFKKMIFDDSAFTDCKFLCCELIECTGTITFNNCVFESVEINNFDMTRATFIDCSFIESDILHCKNIEFVNCVMSDTKVIKSEVKSSTKYVRKGKRVHDEQFDYAPASKKTFKRYSSFPCNICHTQCKSMKALKKHRETFKKVGVSCAKFINECPACGYVASVSGSAHLYVKHAQSCGEVKKMACIE